MKIRENLHLCYSLNVYPGTTWEEKKVVLTEKLPLIREQIASGDDQPFAAGLWLDHQTVDLFSDPAVLMDARTLLADHNDYIFTVNAFPYGEFHGRRVKESVYSPDWTDPKRLDYTCRVADILVDLLPDGMSGSISTLPGSFKSWIRDEAALEEIARNLLSAAGHLCQLEAKFHKRVVLAVEMEPECLWADPDEFIEFYGKYIADHVEFAPYIGVCYDTCHQELTGNLPGEGLEKLILNRVPVAKIQLSSAVCSPDAGSKRALRNCFEDDVYLHQTLVKAGNGKIMFTDLPDALTDAAKWQTFPWTVHYHIPVYLENLPQGLEPANGELLAVLKRMKDAPGLCQHLEIETYTYSVLPGELRSLSLEDSIAKEYRWVLGRLGV